MATLVSVARANFGGEVALSAEGLPAGVSMNLENVAANLDIVPVVFEATAAAAPSGSLANLLARHVDPKHPPITSRFSQSLELVTGGPGQSVYWTNEVNRLAVSVTDEVPYSIEIVEPKVPIVQTGVMQLKVIAKRKPGFTAAITVYPIFNPPGVGIAAGATIPANVNETLMAMNAAPNAQVRKWKTAVIAVSDIGKGPMWTSSQLANFEVVAPFVGL